tara:strand:- start:248 stop:598 length:351 start_codon:yes stop_codon:yes gene_type:complete
MSLYKELAGYLLPEGVLDYFELTEVKKEGEGLHIYLEEKDEIPEEYKSEPYRSNGFMQERKIRDFSIRDYLVTLHVKRRRWLLTTSGKKIKRDWNIIAPGTGMTKDLAAFLKEITG